jgi:hypothetical protein
MLQTILIFAAEAEETSKTSFYIAGGLLVVWALALTAVGMRSETFPGSVQVERTVIGISVLLVALAMVTSVLTG